MLVKFEQDARTSEPDIFLEGFDVEKFTTDLKNALKNPNFDSARCIICIIDEQIVGRIDFSIASSFSFGENSQVYVDWIYVLKEFRHQGVAQFLLSQMENYVKQMGINKYFLLMAENNEAQSFYRSLDSVEISSYDVLKKYL